MLQSEFILSSSPLEELKNLNQARTSLMECQSVDEVVKKSLELVRDKLNCQVASIFLFTKDGVIKRKGINGIDKEGNSIDNSWFPDEEYAPGASFSGKAIPTFEAKSGFGEPQWSNNLRQFAMDEQTQGPYIEKLGDLKCGISVPLNGRYRTFGTLEVLNKLGDLRFNNLPIIWLLLREINCMAGIIFLRESLDKLDDGKFSHNNVYWLTLIATSVANFISYFRRKKEVDAFTQITQKLIYVEETNNGFDSPEQEVYDLVVEKITEDYTPYKACILRIANDNGDLECKAKSGASDVDWLNVREDVKKASSGIAGEVYKTKQPKFIENIDSTNLRQFYNQELIQQNNFKSYVCLPLIVQGKVLGTISVFIRYRHKFYTNQKYFLSNIVFLTAATIARVRLVRDLQQIRQERDEVKDQILSAIRFAKVDYFLQGVLHQYKNDLLEFHHSFKIILDSSSKSKIEQIINNKMSFIEERVKTLQEDSTPDTITAININDVIKQVLRSFFVSRRIRIVSDFDPEIPFIEINEAKIKEVVYNLISNAIKAIKMTNNTIGKIFVSTEIITLKRTPYIQIVVEDNGVGIPNESREEIFKKGMTTSKEQGGTGMGLFVTREIIQNYGGKIEFESTVGKGTKFYIKIPLKRYLPS